MLHRLALPPYESVRQFENGGNYAVGRYYKCPTRYFYRKKFSLILQMLQRGKVYRNILDFGCGKAELFKTELSLHALTVKCIDNVDNIMSHWKFDVVVCASVLEFVELDSTLERLKHVTHPSGMMIGASVMDTPLTRLYFKIIGDTTKRHSHRDVMRAISKRFFVVDYRKWWGLYFTWKAYPK